MSSFPRFGLKLSAKRFYTLKPVKKNFKQVKCVRADDANPFDGLDANKPVRLKGMFKDIPAVEKWFKSPGMVEGTDSKPRNLRKKNGLFDTSTFIIQPSQLNIDYLGQFGESIVPLELTRTKKAKSFIHRDLSEGDTTIFERLEAPFSLLLSNISKPKDAPETHLYLAQHSLADLPTAMQADLPMPSLISKFGKGDIYGSSLWMGRAPTRTPLHRDPNPNLFVQLVGNKSVRLMEPNFGRQLFERITTELGQTGRTANMRGEEMMQGKEMRALERAIWDDKTNDGSIRGLQVNLKRGDGLYIPLGWWHAVRGIGSGVNASVNWWFR